MVYVLTLLAALLFGGAAQAQCIGSLASDGTNPCPDAATFRSNLGIGTGSGSVTSVTFTGDGTVLSSTPSAAVTTTGTVAAALANQSANTVLSGPTSGGAAAPTFRALGMADIPEALRTRTYGLIIGGGTTVPATGIQGSIYIPTACTITGYQLRALTFTSGSTGSMVLDLWRDAKANFPPTVADTITASAKPTLSSAASSYSTTLTGWTAAVAAEDEIVVNLDSISTITQAAFQFTCLQN